MGLEEGRRAEAATLAWSWAEEVREKALVRGDIVSEAGAGAGKMALPLLSHRLRGPPWETWGSAPVTEGVRGHRGPVRSESVSFFFFFRVGGYCCTKSRGLRGTFLSLFTGRCTIASERR